MTYDLGARDDYARLVIQAGRDLGITPRGIAIGLATVYVESAWKIWANRKVAASLILPYDDIGSDGYSVGLFQQQVRMSSVGWWWGPAEICMDPYQSARLFFGRLARLDYNNTSRSPGSYAQQVQQSAYPDRYDQRMTEAQALYDRLAGGTVPDVPAFDYQITKVMHGFNPNTPANATGNSNGPRAKTAYAVVHTQEGDGTAVSLANYCNSTWDKGLKAVSYNLTVDSIDTVEVVPVTESSWSAVDANDIAVHLCFAGSRAAWTRADWLSRDAMLKRGAKAIAAACKQFDIPAVKVLSSGGWPVTPKGIAGHVDFGTRGGGHTDPGVSFPWTEFVGMVQGYLTPDPGTQPPDVPADDPVDTPDPLIDLHRQFLGLWEMLGWRTPVEALAVLLDAATGSKNAGKTGWKAL